jgi:enoyl-CoA hydratase/carnithine racemase
MTTQNSSTPILTIDGPRADIRLNRPDKLNRIEPADLEALDRHLDTIEGDPSLRVIVLTGSGRVFSAGYHIGDLDEQHSGTRTPTGDEVDFETVANRIEGCPLPTICRLNGSVYGGSTDFALACDFRIGIEGTEMVMPAARLGTHYYQGGLERYVTRLGVSAAKRLFMASLPQSSDDMLRIGFLDEAVPAEELDARVDALAARLARNAPLSVRNMKRAMNEIAVSRLDVEAFRAGYAACRESQDFREGVRAWKEKRRPVFEGR